mgnify:CR=1 FL=1
MKNKIYARVNSTDVEFTFSFKRSQYFIYVMEKEDAVMGTELTAKEVPVTVLDMNEKYVAVDEMISGDVIVSSDKDITDGSRVRLEEE